VDTHFDAIVMGAGPAGLTAAIYLARARLKTLVIDNGTIGGQMNLTHEVANYPGILNASGAAIVKTMRTQATSFGAQFIGQADILEFDLSGPEKTVTIDDEGTFTAPVVILTPGGLPRTLGLESEARFKGRGISYCATCDGDFFADKDIAVIGGGNSALEEAVSLTKYARSVKIIHEFDHFQAHEWAIAEAKKNPKVSFLLEQTVTGFKGGESLEGVVSVNKRTGETSETPVTGTFLFIGYVPNTAWLQGHVALNERGEIIVDESLHTNVAGVFAAGDARVKRYRQITTAVADGTVAALAAADYINSLSR
jgi:thioredoxin reductase (NADPH)